MQNQRRMGPKLNQWVWCLLGVGPTRGFRDEFLIFRLGVFKSDSQDGGHTVLPVLKVKIEFLTLLQLFFPKFAWQYYFTRHLFSTCIGNTSNMTVIWLCNIIIVVIWRNGGLFWHQKIPNLCFLKDFIKIEKLALPRIMGIGKVEISSRTHFESNADP
jgi:hypothetical protein